MFQLWTTEIHIMDNHCSHITFEVLNTACKNASLCLQYHSLCSYKFQSLAGIFSLNIDISTEDKYLTSTVLDQLVPVEMVQTHQANWLENKNALRSSFFDAALLCSVVDVGTLSCGHIGLEYFLSFPKAKQRPCFLHQISI